MGKNIFLKTDRIAIMTCFRLIKLQLHCQYDWTRSAKWTYWCWVPDICHKYVSRLFGWGDGKSGPADCRPFTGWNTSSGLASPRRDPACVLHDSCVMLSTPGSGDTWEVAFKSMLPTWAQSMVWMHKGMFLCLCSMAQQPLHPPSQEKSTEH